MKIKLKKSKVNHLTVKGLVNGKKALFIVDTGAEASVIEESWLDRLNLKLSKKTEEVGGVGTSGTTIHLIKKLEIELKGQVFKTRKAFCLDLSQMNEGLKKMGAKPAAGIIGADILKKYKGVIDYDKMILKLTL